MCRSAGFTVGYDHLVDGSPVGELRIALTTEFTRSARSGIETTDDGWVNVFHEE
jgi:hypothetical protein